MRKREMPKILKAFLSLIDTISDKSGKVVCYAVFLIMVITTWEIIGRDILNVSVVWGWTVNKQLFAVFILFGGVYALSKDAHIRIEILYTFFPSKLKTIVKVIAFVNFAIFMGVLIWQCSWMGINSLKMKQVATGSFQLPLYPLKLLIPIVSVLFLLEGVVVFFKHEDP
jgi:TRAP-type mannitol/chloroaromatic compound transport system permease small subunit